MRGWNQEFQQGEDEKSYVGLSNGEAYGSYATLSTFCYLLLCNLIFRPVGHFVRDITQF
jgi:hypothetical protein